MTKKLTSGLFVYIAYTAENKIKTGRIHTILSRTKGRYAYVKINDKFILTPRCIMFTTYADVCLFMEKYWAKQKALAEKQRVKYIRKVIRKKI